MINILHFFLFITTLKRWNICWPLPGAIDQTKCIFLFNYNESVRFNVILRTKTRSRQEQTKFLWKTFSNNLCMVRVPYISTKTKIMTYLTMANELFTNWIISRMFQKFTKNNVKVNVAFKIQYGSRTQLIEWNYFSWIYVIFANMTNCQHNHKIRSLFYYHA